MRPKSEPMDLTLASVLGLFHAGHYAQAAEIATKHGFMLEVKIVFSRGADKPNVVTSSGLDLRFHLSPPHADQHFLDPNGPAKLFALLGSAGYAAPLPGPPRDLEEENDDQATPDDDLFPES